MNKKISLALFVSRGSSLVWRQRKIGLLLFSIQLVTALFLALPLHSKWSVMLDHSRMGAGVLDGFNADFFSEFTARRSDWMAEAGLWMILFAGATWALNLFFNGGLIAAFADSKPNRFPFFFERCGLFFGRMFRLFLLSLPFLIAALIVQSLLGTAFQRLAGGMESRRVIFTAVQAAVLAILIFFINMVFDYAKIIAVNRNRKDMFRTALQSFLFVFRNPGKTFPLYCGIGAAGLALTGIFIGIGRVIDFPSGFGLLFLFLWMQILALARIAIRMEFYASQSVLYRALSTRMKKKR